jgi:hypothetical protein
VLKHSKKMKDGSFVSLTETEPIRKESTMVMSRSELTNAMKHQIERLHERLEKLNKALDQTEGRPFRDPEILKTVQIQWISDVMGEMKMQFMTGQEEDFIRGAEYLVEIADSFRGF